MTIKAVFFDIDGTLVDSNDRHVAAWRAAFEANGTPMDEATIHAQIGKGADQLVPALLPGVDAATQAALAKAHAEAFAPLLAEVMPFPGARDLLRYVAARGQRVVLASSASSREVEHYLDLLGARELVTATTSADDVAHTKPAPDIFAAALAKVAPVTAGEVVVVGDTPYDIEAAHGCGIAAVALRSGNFPDAVLDAARPAAVYDGVAALLADFNASPLAT